MKVNEQILGKYKIVEVLGSGSFSTVYRADEEMTGRAVAIKALHEGPYLEGRMKYLHNEIRAMSKIWGHPNIVSIHTVEPRHDKYIALIIMEYVEGKSLHELMQNGALNMKEALNIGLDICCGLKMAHSEKILHRDLKPENILLTAENQAKVADFGIARTLSDTTAFAGTVTGTRRYMAPEQNFGEYDFRVDLYATGLIIYQAVTGRFPFSAEKEDMDRQKAAGEIEELEVCPEPLQDFLQKALHHEPDARYQTADEMYDALSGIHQSEYIKYATSLINEAAGGRRKTSLAGALERGRKTFRLSREEAERINQNLFYKHQREELNHKSEKLVAQLTQFYDEAAQRAHAYEYRRVISEVHKANRLCLKEYVPQNSDAGGDATLLEKVDNVFHHLSAWENLSNADAPTVDSVIELIHKLPTNEEELLKAWLEGEDAHIATAPVLPPPIQPVERAASSYRLLMEDASPEFLLDKIHGDIQYPHEREALRIYQKAIICMQQERERQARAHYRKLGAFYQKQAHIFGKENDAMELVANCYTRARFAYTAANKQRTAKRNARNGGVYYSRLARRLELQRAWVEAGKSYVLSADNYSYAKQDAQVEECCAAATVCYFNAADSAYLQGDLQTAYDFCMLILAIGEKLQTPTKAVIETEKLLAEIPVRD